LLDSLLQETKMKVVGVLLGVCALAAAQKTGHEKQNLTPDLSMEECTGNQQCTRVNTKVTLDANWRWVHAAGGYQNCYDGNHWDTSLCPDPQTCIQNCELEGVDSNDWRNTYGIEASGDRLSLKFVTHGQYSDNVGSRTYLLDPSGRNYQMFHLLNKEFTFDVDVSNLPCGLNGALYFVEMQADGGMGEFSGNQAGAAYGTGYCDAQCPHDIKFINGEANTIDWNPSDNDQNAGMGHYGACCQEMDIWEANSQASAYTVHPCNLDGFKRCEGVECGDNESGDRFNGVCDKDGCDFHAWRLGNRNFFGKGSNFEVDTNKPMTVVTQFITSDGTDNGELVEVRRVYVQDGRVIENTFSNTNGIDSADSITHEMCQQSKVAFNDYDDYSKKGNIKKMGESLARGHVLVMSLWDDHAANMLWLDSDYPPDRDPSEPGVSRGPCSADSGEPSDVENNVPNSNVVFSKIRVGSIGSTYPSANL